MKDKIRRNQQFLFSLLLYAVLSFIIIIPFIKPGAMIGSGESSITLNPFYYNHLSLWEAKFNLGEAYPHQSDLYLFTFFWKFLELFSFIIHPSIIWVFLTLFLPCLAFHRVFKKILKPEFELVLIPPSLLYTFNVFRTLGPLNERLDLLFILMPIIFYCYFKILKDKSYKMIPSLVILSIICGPLGANLPLLMVLLMLPGLFFLFYLFTNRHELNVKFILASHFIILIGALLGNLYWLNPVLTSLWITFQGSQGGDDIFRQLATGKLIDHLRFIGYWAWNEKRYIADYYPFNKFYDQTLTLISTFAIVIVTFLPVFFNKKHLKEKKLFWFSFTGYLIALFLVNGTKEPIGIIYTFLFENISLMRMFREPFIKFTPLLIFFSSLLLAYSVLILWDKFKTHRAFSVFGIVFLSFIILYNSLPLFNGSAFPTRFWNGGPVGNLVIVPQYWKDAQLFFNSQAKNQRLILSPVTPYGSMYLWEYGANVSGNMADYLLSPELVRGWLNSNNKTAQNYILKSLYEMNPTASLNLISLLDAKYILQENDLDWRYNPKVKSPGESDFWLTSLGANKIKTFGQFSSYSIAQIPNPEPNAKIKNQVTSELLSKEALSLWEIPEKYRLPKFYLSDNVWLYSGDLQDIPSILSSSEFQPGTALISKSDAQDSSFSKNPEVIVGFDESSYNILDPTRDPLARPVPGSVLNLQSWSYKQTFRNEVKHLETLQDLDRLEYLSLLTRYRLIQLTRNNLMSSSMKGKIVENYLQNLGMLTNNLTELTSQTPHTRRLESLVWEIHLALRSANQAFKEPNSLSPNQRSSFSEFQNKFADWRDLIYPYCETSCINFYVNQKGSYFLGSEGTIQDYRLIGNGVELPVGNLKIDAPAGPNGINLMEGKWVPYTLQIGAQDGKIKIINEADRQPNMDNLSTVRAIGTEIPNWGAEERLLRIKVSTNSSVPDLIPIIIESSESNDESNPIIYRVPHRVDYQKECDNTCNFQSVIPIHSIKNYPKATLLLVSGTGFSDPLNKNGPQSLTGAEIMQRSPNQYLLFNQDVKSNHPIQEIEFKRNSATSYDINLPETKTNQLLVMSESYNPKWQEIGHPHFGVTGIIQGWEILPTEPKTLHIGFAPQRNYNITIMVSIITLFISSVSWFILAVLSSQKDLHGN